MTSTTQSALNNQRQKKDRACDACRRRKTKCDGFMLPNQRCTNCTQSHKECTYVEGSTPRGPPKAYITGLEDRLEALEALLHQASPGDDHLEELGPPVVRDSWKTEESHLETAKTKTVQSKNILPPLLISYQPQGPRNIGSTSAISSSSRSTHLHFQTKPRKRNHQKRQDGRSFDQYRSEEEESQDDEPTSPSEVGEVVVPTVDGTAKITLRGIDDANSRFDNNMRFHGRSSTVGLIEITRQMKHIHLQKKAKELSKANPSLIPISPLPETHSRRVEFWARPAWEFSYEINNHKELLNSVLKKFPPFDLANMLIELYFQHSNCIFPLLHRPTFQKHWDEKVYLRDIWFTDVCFSIFAVASRWCSDERVLPVSSNPEEEGATWRMAGWPFFDICMDIHRTRRSLFHQTSLFEIEALILAIMYLKGTSAYPVAWLIIGVALKKAQDAGAHRRKVYRDEPHVDDELWKRAFWHIVVLDRITSAHLGRTCGIAEEDFDLDLPLEVDDDYWESKSDHHQSFKQPHGVPSIISSFNQMIKLTQIIAFALKTLYAIDSTIYQGRIKINSRSMSEQAVNALADWIDNVPLHLKWTHNMDHHVFCNQSSFLHLLYYSTQMLVHRPSIMKTSVAPSVGGNLLNTAAIPPPIPALTDPATVTCIAAAKATASIIHKQKELGFYNFYVPIIVDVSYVCCGLFLLRAWNLKRQDRELQGRGTSDTKTLARYIEEDVEMVKLFLGVLDAVKDRWNFVSQLLPDLHRAFAGLVDNQEDIKSSNYPSQVPYTAPPTASSSTSHHMSTVYTPSPMIHPSKHLHANEMRGYPYAPSSFSNTGAHHPIRFPSRRPAQSIGLGPRADISRNGLWAPALQPSLDGRVRNSSTPLAPLSRQYPLPMSAAPEVPTWTERHPPYPRRGAGTSRDHYSEGHVVGGEMRTYMGSSSQGGMSYEGYSVEFRQPQPTYPPQMPFVQHQTYPTPTMNMTQHSFNHGNPGQPIYPRYRVDNNWGIGHIPMGHAAQPESSTWQSNTNPHLIMPQDGVVVPPRQENNAQMYNNYAHTM